jgi:hypothetical protein
MYKIRNAIQAFLSFFQALGEAFIKISNNTIVPPPAFRPGLQTLRFAAPCQSTNRTQLLFVDTGRNFALIKA